MATRARLQIERVRSPHLVLALAVAIAIAGSVVVAPTGARASGSPGWLVVCKFSHSLPDDPIVTPGAAGGSHLHDFVGNTTTNASSTYQSMVVGGTNCAAEVKDTGGYWAPALYRNGVKVDPSGSYAGRSTRQQVYYRDNNLSLGTPVRSIPADLRLVTGNARATSEAANTKLGSEIYWGCADNSVSGKQKAPNFNCANGILTLHVGFPNCWDGVNLDSADHKSHMAYPKSGNCPSSHPAALPRVIQRYEYPVGTTTGTITLASGPYYTAHGDFWNTWDQPRIDSLVARCLNADVDCGTNPAS